MRLSKKCGIALALPLMLTLSVTIAFLVPRRFGLPTQERDTAVVAIRVARYLYHTGIILPVRTPEVDWSQTFPCLRGKQSFEIGWGDRDFYMSGNITVGLAWKALFQSKASVVNVSGFDTAITDEFLSTEPFAQKKIRLSSANYKRMAAWIRASFALQNGAPIFLREGFWGTSSAFYEANTAQTGAYSIVNNCNVWNSNALDAANLPVPMWSGVPYPLLWMLPE
jgi:uncharacterized protein (TIGR02117 family)